MKGVCGEKLWLPNYQNHLKNLKIKAMISNFIILIITIEIINNGTIVLQVIVTPSVPLKDQTFLSLLRLVFQFCYVPLLCLFMKVLWLAYLHSPYKYTIIRWAAYIGFRVVSLTCLILFESSKAYVEINGYEKLLYVFFIVNMFTLIVIFDFITYLMYSIRFYKHLKSRELEAKLFMDKSTHIENKSVRIHFKIATILVATALFIYNQMNILFSIYMIILSILAISSFRSLKYYSELIYEFEKVYPTYLFQMLFRILLNFNYLYVFFVILYKYWKKKHDLNKVNDRIKPLIREYQDQILNRQYC